jgi:hypothetical protein
VVFEKGDAERRPLFVLIGQQRLEQEGRSPTGDLVPKETLAKNKGSEVPNFKGLISTRIPDELFLWETSKSFYGRVYGCILLNGGWRDRCGCFQSLR